MERRMGKLFNSFTTSLGAGKTKAECLKETSPDIGKITSLVDTIKVICWSPTKNTTKLHGLLELDLSISSTTMSLISKNTTKRQQCDRHLICVI